jgi:hypothetical protein
MRYQRVDMRTWVCNCYGTWVCPCLLLLLLLLLLLAPA